jgi:polyisoprenoid-binding protein YceI
VTYDPKELARDTVEATIDCSTVNTGVASVMLNERAPISSM